MRGARRLGALFLFVASLVVSSEHDDLTNSMIKKGFTATVDRDGNPIYVKMMAMEMAMGESGTIFDAPAVDVDAKTLEDIEFARKWLSLVTLPDPRGDSPMEALQASRQAFGAGHEQTARVRQELDAVRAARRGDEVDGSKLERGPIVLDKPDDGDEKTIDSID